MVQLKSAFPGGGKHVSEITTEETTAWIANEKVPGLDMAKFKAAGLTGMALAKMTPAEVQTLGVSAADAALLIAKLKSTFHHADDPHAPPPDDDDDDDDDDNDAR